MDGRHGVIYRLTRLLYPLSELADAGRQALARQARVLRLPPQARLLARAEQRWLTYLLKGEVAITGPAGLAERIPGGSARARRPLFDTSPQAMEAVAQTGAIVLRFERAQVGSLISAQHQGHAPVELATRVLQACRSDPPFLRLPVAHIRELLGETTRLKDVARTVAHTPWLERRFVAAVNRGNGPAVAGAAEAALRLGMPASRALALCLAVQPLFSARDAELRRRMDDTFGHSLFIGCFAYTLARQHACPDPEQALFAGLLHEAGAVAVLGFVDTHPELGVGRTELDLLLRRLRALTGPMLLERLGLDDFAGVAEHAERWMRASPRLDVTDLVTLAHLLEQPQLPGERPRVEDTPAFQKLGWERFSPQRAARLTAVARSMATALNRRLT
ncbi:MAG: HDOD domain-containing protein [Gammaproteobacteria bacterium]|nr:HDOD domain-containing protein [Gammaproteobacteria bacterium]